MKILICCSGYNSFKENKVTIFALDQAKALCDYGHDVRICAGDVRSIRRIRPWGRWAYEIDGIKVYTANFPCGPLPNYILRPVNRWVAKRCYGLMKQDGWIPDIVHAHFLTEADAYVDLVKADGIPFVMTEHWSMLLGAGVHQSIIDMESNTYWKANKVLTVSTALKESLRHHVGNNLDISVVWNMVDKNFANYVKTRQKDKCFQFLTCGTLIKGKGHDVLLKAFIKISDKSSKLTIMADGPEKDNLKILAKQFGIADRVKFFGAYRREQMAEQLIKSDCFVLASRKETFGVVYIEAMAAGVPVIATDCGGPRDYMDDKVGVLVPVDDVDALAKAMEDMVDGKVKYNSTEIAQYALDNFSPEVIAGKLTKVYEDVLEKR